MITRENPFLGIFGKLERARENRNALETYIQEIFADETYLPHVSLNFNTETGKYDVVVNFLPNLSDLELRFRDIGLITGDIFHNLRSTLDYLVFQMAVLNTRNKVQKPDRIQFPIDDDATKFNNSAKRWLREISQKHRTMIEGLQPYQRVHTRSISCIEFEPLKKLRDINNIDKHQLLTPMMMPSANIRFTNALGSTAEFNFWGYGEVKEFNNFIQQHSGRPGTFYQLGTIIASLSDLKGKLKDKMNENGFSLPQLVFDDKLPIIPVIDEILSLIQDIISGFIRDFEKF